MATEDLGYAELATEGLGSYSRAVNAVRIVISPAEIEEAQWLRALQGMRNIANDPAYMAVQAAAMLNARSSADSLARVCGIGIDDGILTDLLAPFAL